MAKRVLGCWQPCKTQRLPGAMLAQPDTIQKSVNQVGAGC